MKLLLIKWMLAFLVSVGIFFPAHLSARLCNPGKTPTSSPSNCETVSINNTVRKSTVLQFPVPTNYLLANLPNGVGAQDQVGTPPFTFLSVGNIIQSLTPIFPTEGPYVGQTWELEHLWIPCVLFVNNTGGGTPTQAVVTVRLKRYSQTVFEQTFTLPLVAGLLNGLVAPFTIDTDFVNPIELRAPGDLSWSVTVSINGALTAGINASESVILGATYNSSLGTPTGLQSAPGYITYVNKHLTSRR